MNIRVYVYRFPITEECIGGLTWQPGMTTWPIGSSVNRQTYEARGQGPGGHVAHRFVG
jgi:hypothetical protein